MTENQDLDKRVGHVGSSPVTPRHQAIWRWTFMVVVLFCLATVPNILLWGKFVRLENQRNKEHMFWLLCQPGYTSEQRSQAFSELLWQGNQEWRSARLGRLDLTGAQLAGANVQQAHMEGCILAGADLSHAVLRKTQLDQADLSNCDLSGADLFEADLLKADLRGAVFHDANLQGADVGQTNATGTQFVSADMSGARLDLAILTNADLRLAKLVEADLSLADLSSANLAGTDLTNADLTRADLSDANWWRAIGLTTKLIEQFTELYPPSDQAAKERRQDFEKWRAEQIQTHAASQQVL